MTGTKTVLSGIAAKVHTAVTAFAQGSRCDTICKANLTAILGIIKFWPVDPSIT